MSMLPSLTDGQQRMVLAALSTLRLSGHDKFLLDLARRWPTAPINQSLISTCASPFVSFSASCRSKISSAWRRHMLSEIHSQRKKRHDASSTATSTATAAKCREHEATCARGFA